MIKKHILLALSLYINAAALGVLVIWLISSPPDDLADSPPPVAEPDSIELTESESLANAIEWTHAGDRFLVEGRTSDAIRVYRKAVDLTGDVERQWVHLRLAVALESGGFLNQSIAIYNQLAIRANIPVVRLAANVARARIFQLTGRGREAERILWELRLNSADSPRAELIGEAVHLLAQRAIRSCFRGQQYPTLDPGEPLEIASHWVYIDFLTMALGGDLVTAVSRLQLPSSDSQDDSDNPGETDSPDQQAEAAPPEVANSEPAADESVDSPAKRAPVQLLRSLGDSRSKLLAIRVQSMRIVELLALLEQEADVTCQLTPKAQTQLTDLMTTVDVNEIDLASLLYGLLSPESMYWTVTEDNIHILHESDLSLEEIKKLNQDKAAYLVQPAGIGYPTNPSAGLTKAMAGNFRFGLGEHVAAIGSYSELLNQDQVDRELRARTSFNLGKAFWQTSQRVEARRQFYNVVDLLLQGDLPAASLILIAEDNIAQGEFGAAISNATRANQIAERLELRERAAILISIAYLHDRQFLSANDSLVTRRLDIQSETGVAQATCLSAIARLMVAGPDNIDLPGVLRALGDMPQQFLDDPAFALAIARGFKTLGLDHFAENAYRRGLNNAATEYMQKVFVHELSQHHLDNGQGDLAVLVYEHAGSTQDEQTLFRKRLQSAKNLFGRGDLDAALQECKTLQSECQDREILKQTLLLQGKIHQALGDHVNAALAFAGVRDTDATENQLPILNDNNTSEDRR